MQISFSTTTKVEFYKNETVARSIHHPQASIVHCWTQTPLNVDRFVRSCASWIRLTISAFVWSVHRLHGLYLCFCVLHLWDAILFAHLFSGICTTRPVPITYLNLKWQKCTGCKCFDFSVHSTLVPFCIPRFNSFLTKRSKKIYSETRSIENLLKFRMWIESHQVS